MCQTIYKENYYTETASILKGIMGNPFFYTEKKILVKDSNYYLNKFKISSLLENHSTKIGLDSESTISNDNIIVEDKYDYYVKMEPVKEIRIKAKIKSIKKADPKPALTEGF